MTEKEIIIIVGVAQAIFTAILAGIFTFINNNKVEKLKSKWNKHNLIFTEEKIAFHSFLNSWNKWLSTLRIKVEDFRDENFEDLKNYKDELKKDFYLVQTNISSIEMFTDNQELIELMHELVKSTFEYHKNNIYFTDSLFKSLKELKSLESQDLPQLLELIEETKTEIIEYKKQYQHDFRPLLYDVLEKRNQFLIATKKHIRKEL